MDTVLKVVTPVLPVLATLVMVVGVVILVLVVAVVAIVQAGLVEESVRPGVMEDGDDPGGMVLVLKETHKLVQKIVVAGVIGVFLVVVVPEQMVVMTVGELVPVVQQGQIYTMGSV
jgi:hypothetical protein